MARACGQEFWVAAIQTVDGPLRADFDARVPARSLDWTAFYPALVKQQPAA
jgi:hypothetical protein